MFLLHTQTAIPIFDKFSVPRGSLNLSTGNSSIHLVLLVSTVALKLLNQFYWLWYQLIDSNGLGDIYYFKFTQSFYIVSL